MKTTLVILLDELIRSGVGEIALIIQQDEREDFEKLFERDLKLEHYRRLSQKQREWHVWLQSMGWMITYLYQTE